MINWLIKKLNELGSTNGKAIPFHLAILSGYNLESRKVFSPFDLWRTTNDKRNESIR